MSWLIERCLGRSRTTFRGVERVSNASASAGSSFSPPFLRQEKSLWSDFNTSANVMAPSFPIMMSEKRSSWMDHNIVFRQGFGNLFGCVGSETFVPHFIGISGDADFGATILDFSVVVCEQRSHSFGQGIGCENLIRRCVEEWLPAKKGVSYAAIRANLLPLSLRYQSPSPCTQTSVSVFENGHQVVLDKHAFIESPSCMSYQFGLIPSMPPSLSCKCQMESFAKDTVDVKN